MNFIASYKVFGMIISHFSLLSDMSKESKLPITDRCRSHSPDRMVNSCNAVTENDMVMGIAEGDDMSSSPLMTRSLDPTLLYTSSSINQDTNNSDQSESSSTQLVLEDGGAGKKYEFIMSVFL
jgi:hypothetical protein